MINGKNLFREDKMMVAVKHDTNESYINELLRGSKAGNSEKAKAILEDLEKLANDNVLFRLAKAEEMGVKISIN